jgi:hypothetical protein
MINSPSAERSTRRSGLARQKAMNCAADIFSGRLMRQPVSLGNATWTCIYLIISARQPAGGGRYYNVGAAARFERLIPATGDVRSPS